MINKNVGKPEKKVAILQSNYIPWKGYFDMINMVDTFVIYDEVQFTKNDWRNRNLIKTIQGVQWLSIPCRQNSLKQRIDETRITQNNWQKKHWQTLKTIYSKAPFFKTHEDYFEKLYLGTTTEHLSEINYRFIIAVNRLLGIDTKLIFSKELNVSGEKTERLVEICKKLNATKYLSGPAAKDYLKEDLFREKKIQVEWMDYKDYKEYPQLYPPFEHGVSILDLIFNVGPKACDYMKSFNYE